MSSENRGFTYDAAWNLNYLTNAGTLDTFTVDNQNQLTGDPNAPTDTYDANGNLQIRQWSGQLLYAYTNDDENRLTWIENDDYGASPPLWLTQFVYDGLGRMRKRIEYTYNAGGAPVWSSETHYIYDGMRVIQERDTNNAPTVSYTRGTDLSGSLEGAGGIGGLLARSSSYSSGNWSTHYFYHSDGNGNITYLIDSSQAMAATYRYDPYGNTISSSGTQASANVYRFSSKEVHANSGMYMYLYRFYDPSLQRWLNRDPLQETGGVNLFGFNRNDPADVVDAAGLDNFLPGGENAVPALTLSGQVGGGPITTSWPSAMSDPFFLLAGQTMGGMVLGGGTAASAETLGFANTALLLASLLDNLKRNNDDASALGALDLDQMSSSGGCPYRGPFTRAGHSLTKHGAGARPGNSAFPPARGNPQAINQAAQDLLDNILTDPNTTFSPGNRGRIGPTTEVMGPNGQGAVFNAQNDFIFFRE